jgi:hypothetical protein
MTVEKTTKEQRITALSTAAEIYETAETHDLWMGATGQGIHLFRGEVIENDSPGAGVEEGIGPYVGLSGQTVLRKVLHLKDPRTERVQLAFAARERIGHEATLRLAVNGREVLRPPSPIATPLAQQYWDESLNVGEWSCSRWYYVDVPPGVLKEGDNEITVQVVDGRPGWELMVADYRNFYKGMLDPVVLPHTSWVSQDGGQTWESERGEYVLRLALDRFRKNGELVSPVIDAAGEEAAAVNSRRGVQSLRLDWETETPVDTQFQFWIRTGSRSAYDAEHWDGWKPYRPGETVEEIEGRYLQWKAEFSTEDPAQTPLLKSAQVDAGIIKEADAAQSVRVVRAENARILRSSYEVIHEDYGCEMLRELRERFELDAVVAGAQTEFEKIERLMEWAYFIPLEKCRIFPWNVLDWIKLERDEQGAIQMNEYQQRRRDAMCLFPNVVLVAACLSMGIPARHVNFHSEGMSGHEIAEAWSNDYGKWVHLDATRDYYWYDPKTLVPLDTEEIHQVLVERLEQVERWDRPYLFYQDLKELVQDLPIAFREGAHPFSTEEGALVLFRSFCHFRMVLRYNVFSQERPLPVSQGREIWSWDGYLNWADDKVPPLAHFTHHTNRRADFYPTLNQTRYTIECSENPSVLQVYLETETPNFACYLVQVDQEPWQERPEQFQWSLHEALNVLRVRSRNSIGVEGIISAVSVEV